MCGGKRSLCGTRQQAVTTTPVLLQPAVVALVQTAGTPVDLNHTCLKMAKKRRERRESDSLVSADEEVKANPRDSQSPKGGFCLWGLHWASCST